MASPRRIVLVHKRAPGDTTVLTALIRDIALTHPGQFEIDVDTSAMDLWRNNPYLTPIRASKNKRNVEYIKIGYGRGLRDQNFETVHFLGYFHRDFERQCHVKIPLHFPYPDLHLSPEEKASPIVAGRYWIVISGGKSDFTAKVWNVSKMQQVVHNLRDLGLGVVQIGSTDTGHWHPPLDGALNMVGQTNLRDMLRLIYHADGVVCGVTGAMHMASALHRPCVCLGGGREAWWWEAYVNENQGFGAASGKHPMPHRFLHTIGKLDCCKLHGCWRNKVVPLKDDPSICLKPVIYPGQPVPQCMDMITVEHAMEAIMSYYTDHSLPPIGDVIANAAPPKPPALPASDTPPAAPKRRMLDLFATLPAAVAEPPPQPVTPSLIIHKPVVQHTQARVTLPGVKMVHGAKLEGAGPVAARVVATVPGMVAQANYNAPEFFDNPDVGGKFTICALLYGPEKFFDLHKRFLEALVGTLPPGRFDLRLGSNELNQKSLVMVEELVRRGIVTKHYRHPQNDYKYPVMREMFHDPDCPITTKWIVWFDDDSIADRNASWLGILAQAIIQHHRRDNAHMFGAKFVNTLAAGQKQWYESRPWWKKKPFRLHTGQPSPNGNKIVFVTGGFWALTAEAMRACDIPDVDIGHNGGDIVIGEQLWQGGFNTKAFNTDKQFIHTSSVDRRGVTLPMPGTKNHPKLIQVH